MNTPQQQPYAATDAETYDIRIDEQQRRVIQAALRCYVAYMATNGIAPECDMFDTPVAECLEQMISTDGTTPLMPGDMLHGFTI